jgi:Ca2+-binding EF-hand superfamily protein
MYQLVTSLDLQVKDENELDYLIKQIDVDGDGKISFAEFLK